MSAAVTLSDVRGFAELAASASPAALVEKLGHVTESTVSAIQRAGGKVHAHVGGCVVGYWPSDGLRAIEAAFDAVAASDGLSSVTVSIGDVTGAQVGREPEKRFVLVGPAYDRAESVMRELPSGAVGVDLQTYESLPDPLRSRFVLQDTHAVARQPSTPPAARQQRA